MGARRNIIALNRALKYANTTMSFSKDYQREVFIVKEALKELPKKEEAKNKLIRAFLRLMFMSRYENKLIGSCAAQAVIDHATKVLIEIGEGDLVKDARLSYEKERSEKDVK